MDENSQFGAFLDLERTSQAAFGEYKRIVLEKSARKTVLEVGAGRQPLFKPDELRQYDIDYVANDISQVELDAMPVEVPKYAFDASADVPDECVGRFDFIFSKMVQEHIRNTPRYYRNLSRMLKPGGLALNFHPVLYAVPFIINRLMPETLSDPLLYMMRKDRTRERNPKFPALYDHCVISEKVRANLKAQGFREVLQVPFYGHGYYKMFPGIRTVHAKVTSALRRRDFTPLASFSYTVAIK
ncbi:methyltransferase domain-containing protein [Chthonobacter rhizosphaerae]|uniref:methyltransferase domain-containing protein n=1 Tax=Chthonobacter rhizosphaerae TaxID=2735553 RepID=UPI0015EFA855|nr:methyltransferase domain-containing protein [Chthonobacter rhizosphaerae]